jgi:hypothetical protein
MADKTEPMGEDELNSFLDSELRNTIGFGQAGDEISSERARNLEMYLNRPVGDEEEGHSQLQSSDVQDVIEALLPGTLAPFISSDKVVEFKAVGKEDEEYAELATAYINHIFMVDNDGVELQHTWQKDGLLQKNGFVYADWCEKTKTKRMVQRVNFEGLKTFSEDKELEIIEVAAFLNGQQLPEDTAEAVLASQDPMSMDGMEFEVDFRRSWKEGRIKIENIPPEYVLVNKKAKSVESARLIGWMDEVTISDLREEGYDEEKLDKIGVSSGNEYDPEGERLVRTEAQGGLLDEDNDSTDKSMRTVWRTVVWTRVDFDGDGKAELRKIVRAGTKSTGGGQILFNEEADEAPLVSFTPVGMPHQLFGRAIADQAVEIQKGKTSMLRMGMEATYYTINPRWLLVESGMGDDTMDDLLTDIPGAPVRVKDGGAIAPLRDAPDIGAAYQMLEYFDRMREIRTPVTRQDQGVDTNALNKQTATQSQIQANASALKKELILRRYSESLGKLCRMINRLIIKYQDKPRLLRLFPDREPVSVDPRYWNADMDVTVKVGLGTGTKDQQMQSLMMILNEQKQAMQAGLPIVDPEKIYNALSRVVEFSGLSQPELYFNDPKMAQQQGQPPVDPRAQQQQQMEQQKAAEAHQKEMQQMQQQAFEAGKKEGAGMTKMVEIESKERMHAKDTQLTAAELKMRQEENRAQAMGMNV